jgi:acetoin utilization deacetylase AcuC-like enzyme
MIRVGLTIDPIFCRHESHEGHPERPERIQTLLDLVPHWESLGSLVRFDPVEVEEERVLRVHSLGLLERLQETRAIPRSVLDLDTFAGPDSYPVALLMAGSVTQLVKGQAEGLCDVGFVLGRPPGHHAGTANSMGFCLLNNVAIGAQWALDEDLAERVAIVDFDVHHGNGTQEIFYRTAEVLYVSTHQVPHYPGTGAFEEIGMGSGLGFSVNLPLPGGKGDRFFDALFSVIVDPVLKEFDPDLILVSAGFDGHRDDPLGGMLLTEQGYAQLASVLNRIARATCEGRIIYVLEGGYNLAALAGSVTACIAESFSCSAEVPDSGSLEVLGDYWNRVVGAHANYWPSLRR